MSDVISILLVDDEARNLDALEAILEEPGYRLLRADDADKALRVLLEHPVAAIVLDIKMPGVSGFELAKLIKGTKRFREIPILFLTAYMIDDQDVLTGYVAGAVDYLTKPVKPEVLRQKISVFAELFRKTRALADLNETLEARVQERTSELEASEAALRAANAQKDAFLATLAHELRNPLAPLRTGLDLLLQLPKPDPIATRTLSAMNRQLHHMVRLIDDLLEVSRINNGMLELKPERVELMTIIERAIEIVKPFMDQRKQTLAVTASDSVVIAADPVRVSQILGNLLHNASKYSSNGATVRVELAHTDKAAVVRVIDDGVGIPPDQLARAFEMFAKIKRTSRDAHDGLGIGLALARQLAVMHGGTLVADSAGEGCGTTFTLSLPIGEGPASTASQKPVASAGHVLRVVVIEDNKDAADLLVMWLENKGHLVHLARSGPDGLALVGEARPDVVLCDIGMPDMDGMEVCRRIRADYPPYRPLMVALTGWGMDEDRRRSKEAGFDHHLVKPVALDKLEIILSTVRPLTT
jgi:signal transduction histidine kinase